MSLVCCQRLDTQYVLFQGLVAVGPIMVQDRVLG